MKVFFDSNIFLYHLSDEKENATELINNVENGLIEGYVNDVVYSEVIYGFLRGKYMLSPYKLRKEIVHLDLDFLDLKDLFSLFINLSMDVGKELFSFVEKYKLLTNDALIAATCKHHGIKKIATFDPDFKRVEFLEVID